ncbi:anti-sigma factor family protein [Nocardioides hwasunensis]|uniref:Zf-HC2 domain-containing protein n=1 Tax=Nocardioides hwasunensis TaxID=397258 RepID=A0ABR8MHE2_9ACTN|nr:zf-HC2 domain-containing protein [Nocardioides hwasunensis]MBD3915493.1 zf-HC2 domain-containing protein [Nocardioides hwasunensis]
MSASDDTTHRELRELLGSFALGHLDGPEAARVRAHLDGCAQCRAEADDLLPLADRLSLVDPRAFGDVPAPPPALGENVRLAVARARADRDADEVGRRRTEALARRRRGMVRGLAAAAVVVVALGVGGVVGRTTAPEPPQPPLEAISLEVAQGDAVSVDSADLVAHTWGVELRIVADGFAAGETFHAAFRTDDGELVPAGEFLGVGGETMTCFLQSASLREDVTQVVVTDDAGRTVLSSDL